MSKLTEKQNLFCAEYLIDLNATAAAIRAGYSEKSARSIGPENLLKPEIKAEIAILLDKANKRVGVELSEVLEELKLVAFSSMANFATWAGFTVTLKSSDELTAEMLRCVESVATTSAKDGSPQLRIKLHSKMRALETLVKLYELTALEARIAALEARPGNG